MQPVGCTTGASPVFHGPRRNKRVALTFDDGPSGYTPKALDSWAEKVRGWAEQGCDVFVYFDNDMKGYAPHDAMALIERVGR